MALFDFLNFTWLRNLLGIRKDLIDTKKSQLEVQKLKDEERARLIIPATMADIEKYDRKVQRLEEIDFENDYSENLLFSKYLAVTILISLSFLISLVYALYKLIMWIIR